MASTTTPSPEPPAPDAPAEFDELAAGDPAQQALLEVLVVQVGDTAYALPGSMVREVARAVPVTPLPGVLPWVCGVCAVRGALLPVGDLAARATGVAPGQSADATATDSWMVVADDGRRGAVLTGLRVRGVSRARVDEEAAPHATLDAAGLPVRGAVRLVDEGRRSAGAGPVRLVRRTRTRDAALPTPTSPAPMETGSLALLDVSALLHDLYDDGG